MLLSILALGAVMAPLADAKKHKRHKSAREPKPLVIGHRGAGGFVPEHTLQSYKLAIKLGADYVEPDLVMTKDHVLIARHEPILGDSDPSTTGDSTNVGRPSRSSRRARRRGRSTACRPRASGRRTSRSPRSRRSAHGRRAPNRPTQFDGKFKVATFQELINLVKRESKKRGRRIGIYPETKHPTFHESQGLPLEGAIVKTLKKNGLNSKNSPVFLQSFEQGSLKKLNTHDQRAADPADGRQRHGREREPDLRAAVRPALRLDRVGRTGPNDTFGWFATNAGLDEVKTYADGIGPWKVYIVPTAGGGGGAIFSPTDLIQRAHARGLLVHTWTFRDDAFPTGYPGGPVDEYLNFYKLGIDGVFSDFPDTAFAAREIFRGL